MIDDRDPNQEPDGQDERVRDHTDERVEAGLDHLQAAAGELIGAARAFLDVVEELVGDRDRMADVVAAVGSMAESAARGVRRAGADTFGFDGSGFEGFGFEGFGFDGFGPFGSRARARGTDHAAGDPSDDGHDGGTGDGTARPSNVQHIRVS